MVGVSVEESTISESSLNASTAPTTLTRQYSTSNLSHDFLPRLPQPGHSQKETSSSTLTETFTKDLSLLLRSNSRLKCDPYTGSQTVLHPLPEEYKDHSDYAHNLPRNSINLSQPDLESRMLRQKDTDKVKHSENKFYGFLRRGRLASRSAQEKRRSRSADEIIDQAMQSGALSHTDDGHTTRDHGSRFLPLSIKRDPIGPSRRRSTAPVTTSKLLPQLPLDATTSTPHPAISSAHVVSDQSRMKKLFAFSLSLRRPSISKSRPATPHSTHDNPRNSHHQPRPNPLPILLDRRNYPGDADARGHRPDPSFDISEPDSGLGIETVTKLSVALPRKDSFSAVPARASSTPPRIGNGVENSRRVNESNRPRLPGSSTSGRRSPLKVLENSTEFRQKRGKEREGGTSRACRFREPTPAPKHKNQKKTVKISGPKSITGTNILGSFDFEHSSTRARWSSVSPPAPEIPGRDANSHGNGHPWNDPNPTTYSIQEERSTTTRSHSVRGPDRHRQIRSTDATRDAQIRSYRTGNAQSPIQPPPHYSLLPSQSAAQGLRHPKNGNPASAQELSYRPEGGSWGRHTSQRPGGAGDSNGPPQLGMPATSVNRDATRPFYYSDEPQLVTSLPDRYRMFGRREGRSLDLGLDLTWAPNSVNQKALIGSGVKLKWIKEAELKEEREKKLLESFRQVLGESSYHDLLESFNRFTSRSITSDVLVRKAKVLLSAPTSKPSSPNDQDHKEELLRELGDLL